MSSLALGSAYNRKGSPTTIGTRLRDVRLHGQKEANEVQCNRIRRTFRGERAGSNTFTALKIQFSSCASTAALGLNYLGPVL